MNGPMQWTRAGLVPAISFPSGGGAAASAALPEADANAIDDEDDRGDDLAEQQPLLPSVTIQARPVVQPKARKMLATGDVVKLARARLREVEKEVRRLRALERERDELRRLIAAAKNKPRAVVRELPKRSAG